MVKSTLAAFVGVKLKVAESCNLSIILNAVYMKPSYLIFVTLPGAARAARDVWELLRCFYSL